MVREYLQNLEVRMNEKRKFIQVLAGSRQVGKSTIINQFLSKTKIPYVFDSADFVQEDGINWIERLWENARLKLNLEKNVDNNIENNNEKYVILAIDEIQKIPNWSEIVKKFWDEDTRLGNNIKVVLSGSSRLLLEKGLTESLFGRFELLYIPHWSYKEMKDAFAFSIDEYIYFGAYPGAADLIKDEQRWKSYIRDSIVETSVSKDILMLTNVAKPALLRQLFEVGSSYSSCIVSFTKLLGQLNDAGNTTTLAFYLSLLDQSGLLCGLQKYSGSLIRTRSSVPKFQVYNNAFVSAFYNGTFEKAKNESDIWGHFVESAVGMHLVDCQINSDYKTFYWRDGNDEVDYIITKGEKIVGIEVKSGLRKTNTGISAFKKKFPEAKMFVVSSQSESGSVLPLEDFLLMNPADLF